MPPKNRTPLRAVPALPAAPIIRTSERHDFKRCPQRWWWAWREGLKPVGADSAPLWFGTGIHLAMEHFYGPGGAKRGKDMLKVWRDYARDGGTVKMRSGEMNDPTQQPEWVDALKMGEDMLTGYMEMYGSDSHVHVLAVEHPFQITIPSRSTKDPSCVYAGKWDLLWRDLRDDSLWLTDHKTAADMSTKHLTLDDQAGSYWALAAQFLRAQGSIGPKDRLKGIEYNILRKYAVPEDDRPMDADGMRLNKDGSVSKKQPKPLDYRYKRERVHRTAREQASQIQRIAVEAEAMEWMREDPDRLYKTPTRDCSWDCSFFNMCELQERQADWQEFKSMAFKQVDPYADHREAVES